VIEELEKRELLELEITVDLISLFWFLNRWVHLQDVELELRMSEGKRVGIERDVEAKVVP
jgi:hypothetical protein